MPQAQLVTASYGMTFTICGTPDGDVSLWQERYDSVEILEGVFTVAGLSNASAN